MNEKSKRTLQEMEWDLSTYLIHYEKYSKTDLVDELQTIHSKILRFMAELRVEPLEIDEILED